MAIARISSGEIYSTHEEINRVAAPLQVGSFNLPAEVAAKAVGLPMPMQQEGAEFLLENLDAEAVSMAEKDGYVYRRAGCYVPPREKDGPCHFCTNDLTSGHVSAELSEADLKAYSTPHHVLAGDLHFVFSGLIIKGLVLKDGLQAVVYVQAGEWIRLNQTILNWPIFPAGVPVTAVSYFDRQPNPDTNNYDMDLHPEVEVLPEMIY